jgi:hypothetical protein
MTSQNFSNFCFKTLSPHTHVFLSLISRLAKYECYCDAGAIVIKIIIDSATPVIYTHNTFDNHSLASRFFDSCIQPTMTMVSSPRVLTCSYNRRRTRIHPLVETDCTMNVHQTSKPVQSSLKPTRSDQPVHKPTLSSSENIAAWPLLGDEKHSESEGLSQSGSAELFADDLHSIFRAMADYNDQEDMMVLKRASPVYDSDDEDNMPAPSKRQRSSGESFLQWSSQLTEHQEGGFCLAALKDQN